MACRLSRQIGRGAPVAALAVLTLVGGCAHDKTTAVESQTQAINAATRPDRSKGKTRAAEAAQASSKADKAEPVNLLDSRPETIDSMTKGLRHIGAYLDILRVEVPLGKLSESHELWQYLDEQAFKDDRVVTLKRNGLRVGVGRPESWEPIKAILDGIEDRLIYHESASLSMSVLSLEISTGPDDQTIFFFRRDGQMVGESFPGSRNLFQVSYEIRPKDPGKLAMRIIPEIRQNERKLAWTRQGRRYVRVPVYRGRVLHDLAIDVSLSSGGFVVIGASREIELNSLVGRVLLTREVEGRKYESIFFLTPQLVQGGVGSG